MKIVKYLFLFILIIALVFAGVGIYISTQYGTIVQKLVAKAINENLKSEVRVGSIEVSTFDEIPYFSLVFRGVAIMEPKDYQKTPDTLIFVKELSLQFDMLDMLAGNYQLKRVEISDGFGIFEVNKKGVQNFIFWKLDTTDFETSEFQFKLSHLELNRIKYSYIDKSKKVGVRTVAKSAIVTGDFNSKKLKLLVKGDFHSTSVEVDGIQYLSKRNLEINTGLQINNETNVINFLQGEIRFNNAFTLVASGKIDGPSYVFDIGSKKIRLEQLNSLVPKKYSDYKNRYESSGDIEVQVKIKGNYDKSAAPSVRTNFSLKDGTLKEKESKGIIENISLEGYYTNGKNRNAKTSKLLFEKLSGSFPSGKMVGELKLEDFDKLVFSTKLSGSSDLREIVEFSNINNVDVTKGLLDFDVDVKLILSRLMKENVNLKGSNLKGNIQFSDVNIRFENSVNVQNLNGEIKLHNKIAQIIGVKGWVQSSEIELNGEIQNVLHWIFVRDSLRSQPLRIMASLSSDRLDALEFLTKKSKDEKGQEQNGFRFPFSELQLNVHFGDFVWDRFKASDLNAKLLLSNGRVVMNPVTFNSMDGEFEGKLILNKQYDNTFKMKLISNNRNTNVQKMFYSFYNFRQNEITEKIIEGTADISLVLNSELSENFEIYLESVDSKAKVKIVNGKLIEYKSLKAISDYFRSNILLRGVFRADELEKSLMQIRFDILENEIIIQDKKVILPRMIIGTTLLTLNIEGNIDFNGVMDYRIDFDISDLLVKDKSKIENNESISDLESEGIRVFIHMFGPSDNPRIEMDKERRKAYKKNKRSAEKNEFKSALKEEFGLFDADSSLKDPVIIQDFDIEWEEEEDSATVVSTKKDSSKTKKKGVKQIFKLGSKEETEEFDFGDDDF